MIHGWSGLKLLEKPDSLNLGVSWASFEGELCANTSETHGHERVTKRDDSNIEIFPQYKILAT